MWITEIPHISRSPGPRPSKDQPFFLLKKDRLADGVLLALGFRPPFWHLPSLFGRRPTQTRLAPWAWLGGFKTQTSPSVSTIRFFGSSTRPDVPLSGRPEVQYREVQMFFCLRFSLWPKKQRWWKVQKGRRCPNTREGEGGKCFLSLRGGFGEAFWCFVGTALWFAKTQQEHGSSARSCTHPIKFLGNVFLEDTVI